MKRVLLVGASALVFAGAMTGAAFARGPGGGGGGGGHAAYGGGGGGGFARGGGGFAAPRASVGGGFAAPRASVGGNFARGATVNRGFARGGVAQGNWGARGWNGGTWNHHRRGFVPFAGVAAGIAIGSAYAYDYPDYGYYSGDQCIQWNGWAWVNVCY
jgi:hypothetical protein